MLINSNRIDDTNHVQTLRDWKKMAGAMVLRRGGKQNRGLRVVVLKEVTVDGKKEMQEVELKPSLLVRKLLLYIICQYVKSHKQAVEVLVCTVPGKCIYTFSKWYLRFYNQQYNALPVI